MWWADELTLTIGQFAFESAYFNNNKKHVFLAIINGQMVGSIKFGRYYASASDLLVMKQLCI